MQIKGQKLLIALSLLWAFLVLTLGSWWLFIIYKYGKLIESYNEIDPVLKSKASLILWEGGTFFILILLLTGSLWALFYKDHKKTKSLQAFFASLTHELKTPLASVRLQAEVISDNLQESDNPHLHKLSDRLIEDTSKLELEMDKILQLSRIERGADLSPSPISLQGFFRSEVFKGVDLELDHQDQDLAINADQFALKIIFRNLCQNTLIHSGSNFSKIEVEKDGDMAVIKYSDSGEFSGNTEKLGQLFYKHRSTKGSGIGLYLSKRLIEKMGGEFLVESVNPFTLKMTFPQSHGEDI